MTTPLIDARRTSYCGEVTRAAEGNQVVLKGWVHNHRDHGGVYFIDLRDREGLAQLVFDPEVLSPEAFERATRLRYEDVIAIRGTVRARPEGTVNANLRTGEIEIMVGEYEVLSTAEPLPVPVDEHTKTSEDLRLKYRYLDLRRTTMQNNLRLRAKVAGLMRRVLDSHGFLEIETPCLTRSTPEGARDFLVPSRLNPGTFYALPQSPQLFKQLLMVAGYDRYYQIVRCFRDEDLRANRQPEFTQLDIEMSFIQPDDLFEVMEAMLKEIFKEAKGIEIATPFPRMDYDEAILRYGSDKPDRRFGVEIHELSAAIAAGGCDFKVFNEIVESGGVVRGICVPGGGEKYSNTQLKPGGELPAFAARYGGKGLAWFRVVEAEGTLALASSIDKFFQPQCQQAIIAAAGAAAGDLILIVADKPKLAATVLGQIRLKVAADLALIPEGKYEFLWVVNFPLLEYDEETKRYYSTHHPFTMPNREDWDKLESDPASVKSLAYDLALNGEEVGGGSIRIHRSDIQARVFTALGISDEEAKEKFGFLMDAFQYGPPPHGGIAFGVDRVMMLLLGTDSIRDVIAFPKTQTGADLMVNAPSEVDEAQLKELSLKSTVKR